MFRKILIANRGEPVVRIARAAHSLGIQCVGVASDADLEASWLECLDEVVPIGGKAPRDSYLDMASVVQAGVQTGCVAVHPGWGFLAENPRFAALCAQHGMTFVGPSPAVMQRMALKWPAKASMRAAGLVCIPGSEGLLPDLATGRQLADQMGYPVILKADAGGGGRGMRRVFEPGQFAQAYQSAQAEAQAAFGNGALYLERYLTGGRHIEFQILADAFGHAVHLFERDCSVQRNHQKLIEEGPSPALSAEDRMRVGQQVAMAAAAIGYHGAGTVEFLRRADTGELCFMEMNTRLQVEHCVSEMVTGVDIVAQQIRIAANEHLELTQDALTLKGHAMEIRLNAEDPDANFQPTPGLLTAFTIPTDQGPGTVRVDTHLRAGDRISPYYDSLLAKVIAHGRSRAEAIETLVKTLRATRVEGVKTTAGLHLKVLQSPAFQSGDYDTSAIPGFPQSRA
ncbi:MAG: ATP-grasp domain-containing protein [Planctomycetes bacterium]|nr:ATP-grasp domain-containing protein [Planctomycetota bacterium]MCB9912401.1 ATP-grasp domain-containing protein [Planctomycetota bacterium]HPF15579.1 biotin carboxylase N-terminal domain-containing protein [Planctomycetota bacterium]HRV81064.1 biotin carboxylase N-terminal domain-containing protein [Planctomycetota bacterium]